MLDITTKMPMQQSEVYILPPLVTRELYAKACGLELGVFISQCERGYWPLQSIGKRVFVNVEAIRIAAAKKAEQFTF
jgi:hypothetical protein